MDINPYKFESPWEAYEFANFHVQARTRLILCSMAWLHDRDTFDDNETPSLARLYHGEQDLVHKDTLLYWINRFCPLIEASESSSSLEFTVVIANRVGNEPGNSHRF